MMEVAEEEVNAEPPRYIVGPPECGDLFHPVLNSRSSCVVCWCESRQQAKEVAAQLERGMWRNDDRH